MTPVTNNNKVILRGEDEENNPGHEIILRSLPNEDEMSSATNHPEEEEPDADEDEDEQPFSYGRWRPAWRRSRALTAFLAAAGVAAAVGTASVVFRAAGGKASTTITSNMQVANVPAPAGYEVVGNVGDGTCQDGNQPITRNYPYVTYSGVSGDSVSDVDECATKCNECVAVDFPLVGMSHNPNYARGYCDCYVSQTGSLNFSKFSNSGPCFSAFTEDGNSGTGPIAGTFPFADGTTCYCREGQCPGDTDAPSIAPSESPIARPSDIPSVAPSIPAPSDIPSVSPSTPAPSDIPSAAPSSSSISKASKRPKGPKASKMPKASSSLQVQQMKSGGPSFSSLSVAGVCGTFAVVIITFMFIDLI